MKVNIKQTLGLLLLFVTSFALAGDRVTGSSYSTRSEVIATHGMVESAARHSGRAGYP